MSGGNDITLAIHGLTLVGMEKEETRSKPGLRLPNKLIE